MFKLKRIYKLLRNQLSGYRYFLKRGSKFHKEVKLKVVLNSKSSLSNSLNSYKHIICFKYDYRNDGISYYLSKDEGVYEIQDLPTTNAEFLLLDSAFLLQDHILEHNLHGLLLPLSSLISNFRSVSKNIEKRYLYISRFMLLGNRPYLLFEKKKFVRTNEARRYIPHYLDRLEFLKKLKNDCINYVVLRWFDELPCANDVLEDIDILVDDKDLLRLTDICNSSVGFLPLDVYSVSGLSGSAWASMPYYPAIIAESTLENKVDHPQGYTIPSSYDHLITLAYHAVYHKGDNSHLPIHKGDERNLKGDHDYFEVISNLLSQNNFTSYNASLTSLKHLIESEGIDVGLDYLLKLQTHKPNDGWIENLVSERINSIDKQYHKISGIAVFLIREKAYSRENIIYLKQILEIYGFYILDKNNLPKDKSQSIMNAIRGGNWSRGPFLESGGLPSYYIIAFDPFSKKPSDEELKKFPHLENKKIAEVKEHCRGAFSKDGKFNGLHSSDNFYESIEYIKLLKADETYVDNIYSSCLDIVNNYKGSYPVIENLSAHSKRAKVELVSFRNSKAVKKTYNNINGLSHFKREVNFYKQFKDAPFLPALLEVGENYLVLEYLSGYKDLECAKHISKSLAKKIRDIFQYFSNENYAIIDLNAKNFLINGSDLKVVDFEFAQPMENPKFLESSYDLTTVPDDFQGDLPYGYDKERNYYDIHWKSILGLSLSEFVSL